jgi:hypothetical protein
VSGKAHSLRLEAYCDGSCHAWQRAFLILRIDGPVKAVQRETVDQPRSPPVAARPPGRRRANSLCPI